MSFVVAYYTRFHNLSAIVRKYFCMPERKLREFLHLLQLSYLVLVAVSKTILLELTFAHSLGKKVHFAVERADVKLIAN